MRNHILIYNSAGQESKLWLEVIRALRGEHYFFTIISRDKNLEKQSSPWLPKAAGRLIISLPFWYMVATCGIIRRTLFSKIKTMVLVHWPEKILLSPVATWLGWRVIWLELPDSQSPQNWLQKFLYTRTAQHAEIIVFNQQRFDHWQTVSRPREIHQVRPALFPRSVRQIDLFQALANRPYRQRFVIGATVNNLEMALIEPLLSALRHALSISPRLELLIIGEGETRKQLMWLIRKMGLGNNVWLAGETFDLLHHLEHIDLYVMAHAQASLEDISTAILVLQHGIPIISQAQSGCEAILSPDIGATINLNDSEALAAEFLRFEQLADLKSRVARQARAQAEQFTFETLLNRFQTIFTLTPSKTNHHE